MKQGYDKFFKQAQKLAESGGNTSSASTPRQPSSSERSKLPAKSQLSSSSESPFSSSSPQNSGQIAQNIRKSIEAKRIKKAKAKKGISWKLAGFSILGLVAAYFGSQSVDKIDKFVRSVEINFFGRAFAESDAKPSTAASEKKADAAEKATAGKSGDGTSASEEAGSAPKEGGEVSVDHFQKLNERKKTLDAREEELARAEAEVSAQKQELEKRLEGLEQTRRQISSILEDRVKVDDQKVESLVQMYSGMKPQQAAKIFESMDEDLAVEILGRMKKKSAAEVMNLMKAEKAQVLSEKYAGYKRQPSSSNQQQPPTKEGGKTP